MAALTSGERHFLLRRLHSLTGIIPIGGFLLFHFFENAAARHGAEAFNETVLKISQMPYLYVMELAVLLVPILFHGLYGVLISFEASPNNQHYCYPRNWAYLLQRVSGVLALLFICYHVTSTRGWALFVKGEAYTFYDMQLSLSVGWVLALYIVGIISATFHFTNGLWSFCITWGIVRTQAAMDRLAVITMVLFLGLCSIGLDILSSFVLDAPAFTLLGNFLASLIPA